jgi:hypothetical protein
MMNVYGPLTPISSALSAATFFTVPARDQRREVARRGRAGQAHEHERALDRWIDHAKRVACT